MKYSVSNYWSVTFKSNGLVCILFPPRKQCSRVRSVFLANDVSFRVQARKTVRKHYFYRSIILPKMGNDWWLLMARCMLSFTSVLNCLQYSLLLWRAVATVCSSLYFWDELWLKCSSSYICSKLWLKQACCTLYICGERWPQLAIGLVSISVVSFAIVSALM